MHPETPMSAPTAPGLARSPLPGQQPRANRRTRPAFGAMAALATLAVVSAGCEAGPTGPELPLADDAAAEVISAHWHQLPGLESLHLATVAQLAAGGGTRAAEPGASGAPGARMLEPQVADLLEGLAVLAADAWDLRQGSGGSMGNARVLEDAVGVALDEGWMALTGAVQGPEVAAAMVEGVATALTAFEAALASAGAARGSTTSPAGQADPAARAEAARRLAAAQQARAEAQRRMAAARAALAVGRPGWAMAEAAAAADVLKGTIPADRATAFVIAAKDLLARAQALAGPSPAPEIAALLDEAGARCQEAADAVGQGAFREAVQLAGACARIARVVIARLSGGVPDDLLAERAAEAVDQAASLYEQAVAVVEAAGGTPTPSVTEALDEARALLSEAQASLAAGAWRVALGQAHASSAISRRILAGAAGGGSGIEARAEAVVAQARSLLSEVVAAAGANPPPAVERHLAEATTLVVEAEAALQAGDFRTAIVKASRAIPFLQRALLLLTR